MLTEMLECFFGIIMLLAAILMIVAVGCIFFGSLLYGAIYDTTNFFIVVPSGILFFVLMVRYGFNGFEKIVNKITNKFRNV